MTPSSPGVGGVVLSVRDAAISFGQRVLWEELSFDVHEGEFIAVLGSNGSGKTTLLRAILGQQELSAGSLVFDGHPVRGGDRRIGYIPQQQLFTRGTALRGRDLVALGVEGHRFGPPRRNRAAAQEVDRLVREVGAESFAHRPIGELSGGEQQRLRVGQALAGDPHLLVCDEPLLSLDLRNQRAISDLIDRRRQEAGTPVLFVTHDINPVLAMTDKVLYLAGGKFALGTVDEVLRADVLSALFDTPVEVVHSGGRLFVVGVPEHVHHDIPTGRVPGAMVGGGAQ